MGQFKPMVKMETTEPSVILKLKKGGQVAHKMGGGYMPMATPQPMPAGLPARGGAMPSAAPMKPPMAARRRAMMAKKPAMNPTMMKKGGKADDMGQDKAMIKKAFKQHDMQEHEKGSTKLKLKDGGKFATGGVVNGQAGYAKGGIIKSTKGETKVVTAKVDRSPASTGGVKLGNGGGYAMGGKVDDCWESKPANTAKPGKTGGTTGGVRKGNAGGYMEGGSAKKAYATGGTVNTGKPVAMPQKAVSKPVANNMQSGTFAKGGKVEKEDKPNLRLLKTLTGPKGHTAKVYKDKDYGEHRVKFFSPEGKHMSNADYHTDDVGDANDTAKGQLNRYQKGGKVGKYADGDLVDASKGAYDKSIGPSAEDMDMAKAIRSAPRKLLEGAKSMMGMGKPAPKAGSITKTEKSVTVSPKKGGGGC
jgi:hypothetical protein